MKREEYTELELDAKVEMIRTLVPLGLMHVHELLDDEVKAVAGERYARKEQERGRRHGSNPGTVPSPDSVFRSAFPGSGASMVGRFLCGRMRR